MTHHLIIGDYAYSSWSMRAWLLCDRFDLPPAPRFSISARGTWPTSCSPIVRHEPCPP
jgi:hypothetical protein